MGWSPIPEIGHNVCLAMPQAPLDAKRVAKLAPLLAATLAAPANNGNGSAAANLRRLAAAKLLEAAPQQQRVRESAPPDALHRVLRRQLAAAADFLAQLSLDWHVLLQLDSAERRDADGGGSSCERTASSQQSPAAGADSSGGGGSDTLSGCAAAAGSAKLSPEAGRDIGAFARVCSAAITGGMLFVNAAASAAAEAADQAAGLAPAAKLFEDALLALAAL